MREPIVDEGDIDYTRTDEDKYIMNITNEIIRSLSDDEHAPPEEELIEYFIQYRYPDLIDLTNGIEIDMTEHPILFTILNETKEKFRTYIRDAVVKSHALLLHDRYDANIVKTIKRKRNNVDITLLFEPTVTLRELRSEEYEGEIITFEANIADWNTRKSTSEYMDYECSGCGDIITKRYKKNNVTPLKCALCKKELEELYSHKGEDVKRMTLREIINNYDEKSAWYSITADVFGSDLSKIMVADNVMVTGVFRSLPLKLEQGKVVREFLPTIQVISIRKTDDDNKQPPPELLDKFIALENEGKLIDVLIDSFMYNIYKKRMEKKALLCAVAGSVQIGDADNGIQPMIHILFIGDAGTFKSTLMKGVLKILKKSIRVDAMTVSNAGLKAVVVKAPDGSMTIRAGLLPTYNGGILVIDEFGKVDKTIYDDLRNPMMDGRINKHKAGIAMDAIAKTGILASMNPASDSWDYAKTILDNMKPPLDEPLIQRFDLILVFSTKSQDFDKEAQKKLFNKCDSGWKPENIFTYEELTLFFNHVRKMKPVINEDMLTKIGNYFSIIDQKRKDGGKDLVNVRTENSVTKFAISMARLHMKEVVDAICVDEAIELYKHSMLTMELDPEKGEVIASGTLKKGVDGRMNAIKFAYDTLKDKEGYVFRDKLVEESLKYGGGLFNNPHSVEVILNRMKDAGNLSKKNNMIKLSWS